MSGGGKFHEGNVSRKWRKTFAFFARKEVSYQSSYSCSGGGSASPFTGEEGKKRPPGPAKNTFGCGEESFSRKSVPEGSKKSYRQGDLREKGRIATGKHPPKKRTPREPLEIVKPPYYKGRRLFGGETSRRGRGGKVSSTGVLRERDIF